MTPAPVPSPAPIPAPIAAPSPAGEAVAPRAVRTRRCIATGLTGDRAAMVRFVAGPDNTIVPDVAGRLPGRGVWVRADAAALALACRRRLFAKSLRRPVTVPDDLALQVERLLRRHCADLIGLANRAGGATCGHDRVRAWLASGRAALLLAARDGSAAERAKMRGLAGDLPVVDALSAAELGGAFGRERVVHAALAAGKLADKLAAAAARLAGIAGVPGGTGGDSEHLAFSTGQR